MTRQQPAGGPTCYPNAGAKPADKMTYADWVAETNGPIYKPGREPQGGERTRAVPATQVPGRSTQLQAELFGRTLAGVDPPQVDRQTPGRSHDGPLAGPRPGGRPQLLERGIVRLPE